MRRHHPSGNLFVGGGRLDAVILAAKCTPGQEEEAAWEQVAIMGSAGADLSRVCVTMWTGL